jgi:hypothetical protein
MRRKKTWSDHLKAAEEALSSGDRASEITAALVIETVRRLVLLNNTDGLQHMADAGASHIKVLGGRPGFSPRKEAGDSQ